MSENNRLSELQNDRVVKHNTTYSKILKTIQWVFPLLFIAILGMMFLWPQISKIETAPLSKDDLNALKQAETENTLNQATFNTVDKNGNPIEISASQAKQNKTKQDVILLSAPQATINNEDSILNITAKDGTYNQDKKILDLSHAVTVSDEQNNILETENMTADFHNNVATSHSPARLTTKEGVITGQSVTIDQKSQITTFQGPAKAVINP